MTIQADHLVVGSGVAGLTYAIKIAEHFPDRDIVLVTKASLQESNTKYAQGGVAIVVSPQDSFEKHIQDTLQAGDGLCDEEVVRRVVQEGPAGIKELIQWGAHFDLDSDGNFLLGKEGGHSEFRVVHHKDITGAEVQRALIARVQYLKNIEILTHHFALDLILEKSEKTGKKKCMGATVFDTQARRIFAIHATTTLLATGGVGRVYGHTTNPLIATGDGIAMAYRAKAELKDMEFMQFHPTALYQPEGGVSFLISEAVRGFGALLRNKEGDRFMEKIDPRAELASRDIVSQGIVGELHQSGQVCVFLDCRHLDLDAFKSHFPNIYQKCIDLGIDLSQDMIPVIPAAHYLCGGIVVDGDGKTSIDGLFACGECSRTGLHGANRLASNSLLEALVYANQIFIAHQSSRQDYKTRETLQSGIDEKDVGETRLSSTDFTKESAQLSVNLQTLMKNKVGIIRSDKSLEEAMNMLGEIRGKADLMVQKKVDLDLFELRNMIDVAHLMISQSQERNVNKGGFYNSDF